MRNNLIQCQKQGERISGGVYRQARIIVGKIDTHDEFLFPFHSLGCLTSEHWCAASPRSITQCFLPCRFVALVNEVIMYRIWSKEICAYKIQFSAMYIWPYLSETDIIYISIKESKFVGKYLIDWNMLYILEQLFLCWWWYTLAVNKFKIECLVNMRPTASFLIMKQIMDYYS
jgi:hypothetical protein